MDYYEKVEIVFFESFEEMKSKHSGRIITTSASADSSYADFEFKKNDIILMGKESSGLPESVFDSCDFSVKIPIKARSLNLALSSAIILSKASL